MPPFLAKWDTSLIHVLLASMVSIFYEIKTARGLQQLLFPLGSLHCIGFVLLPIYEHYIF